MAEEKTLQEQLGELGDNITKSIMEEMPQAVEKVLEQKGFGKIEKKIFGQFEDVKELEGKEKSAKFFRAVASGNKEMAQAISGKSMTEGTDNEGGYLVPEEFRSEVVRLAEDYGVVRRLARVINVKRDNLKLPKITSSVVVYWPGEGTAGTESQPVLGQVSLAVKTLVGLTALTNELIEDADVDTIDLLVELFAEAIAGEEDKQGLVGTGTPFTGILSDSDVNLVTMGSGDTGFADVDADDLRDMISAVKTTVLPGAGFHMHRSIWGVVQKLKDSGGQYIATVANPIVSKEPGSTGVVGYVWGYPVYLNENMPSLTDSGVSTKYVIFGNLRHLYLGDRKQMTVAVSEHATIGSTNLFESNMSALRITERIAITVGLGSAFAVLRTAAA